MKGAGSTSELALYIQRKDVKRRQSYSYWVHLTRHKLELVVGLAAGRTY
jgi:hypothetical protein